MKQAAFLDTTPVLNNEQKRELSERNSEKTFMKERLSQLPAEIEEEPKRILKRYDVETSQLEPIGIVYLWPEQG